MQNYEEINEYRTKEMIKVATNHQQLNEFHDELMIAIVNTAINSIESEWGPPPAHFAFFLMGSAGRFEQALWSDQDHGLIFDGKEEYQDYFLHLGTEITNGLAKCGYELCDGNVMSSNPLWCKSLNKWTEQLRGWLGEESWSSLRNFSIFIDSRVLVGSKELLLKLKSVSFTIIGESPNLLNRLIDNVGNLQRAIGVFGQFLPIKYGEEAGSIHLKKTIFFPYVNTLRILAIHEQLTKASTLSRFHLLQDKYKNLSVYESNFIRLLDFRLRYSKHSQNYGEIHYLKTSKLSKEDRQILKKIAKSGYQLYEDMKALIKGV